MSDLKVSQLIPDTSCCPDIGPYSDVVLSTQVNLYRNIYSVPFPDMQAHRDTVFLKNLASRFIENSDYSGCFRLLDLNEINPQDKRLLKEKNIISSAMEGKNNCLVLTGGGNNILFNEENHFNIQSVKSGLQIAGAYKDADELDDELNKFAVYAYSEELGYITANPVNLGTGMNISVAMHLPVLTRTRNLPDLRNITGKYSVSISGTRGDGSRALGSVYKAMNSDYYGLTENEIISKTDTAVREIADMECEARDNMISENGRKLEDEICRSYGILKYARVLGFVESMAYLSDVRLGIILSIIKDMKLSVINNLMVNMQLAHMQILAGRSFADPDDCNVFRADYLRKKFTWSGAYE